MKKILIPVILAVLGGASGAGAGFYLRPQKAESDLPKPHVTNAPSALEKGQEPEYARLNGQFIVPVVRRGKISSLVVVSLSLEVSPGTSELVFAKEPKLRSEFLRVLFNYANEGGFEGTFTHFQPLERLRRRLLTTARENLPNMVFDVLITEIGRQDS